MSDGKNDSSQALQIERSKSSAVQYRHRPVEKLRSKCGENKVRVHRDNDPYNFNNCINMINLATNVRTHRTCSGEGGVSGQGH